METGVEIVELYHEKSLDLEALTDYSASGHYRGGAER